MKIETKIKLDRFQPRSYQLPVIRALEENKYRKIMLVWPRRSGKDILAFNLMIRQALERVAVYFYIFPTYAQGKKVLWNSITNDGVRFLDFIPPEIVASTNSQDMTIKLINGSLIQIVGSDNVDSLVGTNPYGVIYSEAALQDPKAYQFLRPILTANGGWCIFISTPRGKNFFHEMYQIALYNTQEWYVSKLTLEDTKHIPLWEIEKERADGLLSEDLIQQEYYTSWDLGIEGSYYSKYLDRMKVQNRISDVPWENSIKVHTAWDLGMRDATTIIFFQVAGQSVRIIDCYENTGMGLDHYVKVLQQKPYTYGRHIAPHDIKVRELGTGMSRLEKARTLGLTFTVAPDLSIEDGIEAVRTTLSKVWIDVNSCKDLIKALENYRHEYDSRKQIYKNNPLHDWSSHYADCFRYLCISLPKTADGLTAEQLEQRYHEAVMMPNNSMPRFFRDDESK